MVNIVITPSKIFKINFYLIIGLLVLHCLTLRDYYLVENLIYASPLTKFFNFDLEYNLPSLYSTIALIFSSFLCFNLSLFSACLRADKFYWRFLSFSFMFLAFDEFKGIHERLNIHVYSFFKSIGVHSFIQFGAWTYVYFFISILLFIGLLPFLAKLDQQIRLLLFLSFFLFLLGAVGFEFLAFQVLKIWKHDFFYLIMMTLEELLEMIAVLVFNYTLLRLLSKRMKVTFTSS